MTDDAAPSDLDQLLGACVEAAARLLAENGEFYPFALAVSADGEIVSPSIDPGSDHPSADHVATLLLEALRTSRAEIRAAASCSDVRLRSDAGEERDAIRIELESPEMDQLVVVVPYAGGVLEEPFGMPGERRVFG